MNTVWKNEKEQVMTVLETGISAGIVPVRSGSGKLTRCML